MNYHEPKWPARVRDAAPGRGGVAVAFNAARGGAASALQCVAAGGRLVTITNDPPPQERGISVSDVYVEANGTRLGRLVAALADGTLSLDVAATLPSQTRPPHSKR